VDASDLATLVCLQNRLNELDENLAGDIRRWLAFLSFGLPSVFSRRDDLSTATPPVRFARLR
jgi:hypothetical protein